MNTATTEAMTVVGDCLPPCGTAGAQIAFPTEFVRRPKLQYLYQHGLSVCAASHLYWEHLFSPARASITLSNEAASFQLEMPRDNK